VTSQVSGELVSLRINKRADVSLITIEDDTPLTESIPLFPIAEIEKQTEKTKHNAMSFFIKAPFFLDNVYIFK
jgi:hypothetical protein